MHTCFQMIKLIVGCFPTMVLIVSIECSTDASRDGRTADYHKVILMDLLKTDEEESLRHGEQSST